MLKVVVTGIRAPRVASSINRLWTSGRPRYATATPTSRPKLTRSPSWNTICSLTSAVATRSPLKS